MLAALYWGSALGQHNQHQIYHFHVRLGEALILDQSLLGLLNMLKEVESSSAYRLREVV